MSYVMTHGWLEIPEKKSLPHWHCLHLEVNGHRGPFDRHISSMGPTQVTQLPQFHYLKYQRPGDKLLFDHSYLGGGNSNICWFSTRNLGKSSNLTIWRIFFKMGLKPPTSYTGCPPQAVGPTRILQTNHHFSPWSHQLRRQWSGPGWGIEYW